MQQLQLFLPLYNNKGKRFPHTHYTMLEQALTSRFGGVTIYQRMPVVGLWKAKNKNLYDELLIMEVLVASLDRPYWESLKIHLEKLFHQKDLMIRCSRVYLI